MTIKTEVDYGREEAAYAAWYFRSTEELRKKLSEPKMIKGLDAEKELKKILKEEEEKLFVKPTINPGNTSVVFVTNVGSNYTFGPAIDANSVTFSAPKYKQILNEPIEYQAQPPKYVRKERGDGYTTYQMKNAPQNAFFVVLGGEAYYNYLKQDIDRRDIKVIPYHKQRLREIFKGLAAHMVVDHAVWEYLSEDNRKSEWCDLTELEAQLKRQMNTSVMKKDNTKLKFEVTPMGCKYQEYDF